jgi:hypothetical protein
MPSADYIAGQNAGLVLGMTMGLTVGGGKSDGSFLKGTTIEAIYSIAMSGPVLDITVIGESVRTYAPVFPRQTVPAAVLDAGVIGETMGFVPTTMPPGGVVNYEIEHGVIVWPGP